MTLEHLYKKDLDDSIISYRERSLSPLRNFVLPVIDKKDILGLLATEKQLLKMSGDLSAVTIPAFSYSLQNKVEEHYSKLEISNTQEKSRLLDECEVAKQKAESDYEDALIAQHDYNESLINPYREKHQQLLEYKDKVKSICKRYNISPLDMEISDTLTKEEFETLIDESIAICDTYVKKDTGLFQKAISPLRGEGNLQFALCYVGMAIGIIYFLLPVLSIGVFTLMIGSTYGLYKDLEKLKIAVALMTQIDYNRFVEKDKLAPPERPDLNAIEEEYNARIASVPSVSEERDEAMQAVVIDNKDVAERVTAVNAEVKAAYAEKQKEVDSALKYVQDTINAYLKDYKPFPTVQKNSIVMCHEYTLGRIENRLDVTATLPQSNIVFDCSDYQRGINLMKLYLCNALLSVQVKQLTVDMFDPKGLCKDFAEFFNQDTAKFIRPNNSTLNKMLEEFRAYSQENIKKLDHKDIDTYNKEAEEKEMTPLPYRLLIILSEYKELKEGEKANVFKEYFKYSAESGVMIWLLDTQKWGGSLWVDGSYALNKGLALEYTMELGYKAIDTFTTAVAKYKDTGIAYGPRFADKYIPREKWWTYDTIKGIDLHFGLQDGDPTRGFPVTLGDANVHGIMGGATGAGKSATINQMLISLITKYPPSELQIVFVDFKNVEAAKFTKGYVKEEKRWMTIEEEKDLRDREEYYTRLSRIPHLRIISGTTDGEYALSVFEFLMQEMQRRQLLINKFGVTKVQEMREQILAQYNTGHNGNPKSGTWAEMRKNWDWYKPNVYDKYGDLPRLLILFDEFQVMYNTEFVPQRVIDAINGKITAITKLARAMACHLFFTSQSMKGTMSQDTMANFSLRAALRSTKEVSEELLGNGAASTITQKFGYIYTNDTAGQDKTANKKWRVPFLDEKDMPKYIDALYPMLEEFNETHDMAEFYNEKQLVPARIIDEWYHEYPDTFKDPDTFIFGERSDFSTNKAPVSVNLLNDTGENILIAGFERDDVLNLVLTLTDNLLHKTEDCDIVMSVMDKDCYTLLDVPSIVQPELLSIAGPEQDTGEFIDTLQAMIDFRVESGGTYRPMYIFCIMWENAPGISVNENGRLQDKFRDVLRVAPKVGMHFVFAFRNKPQSFVSFIPASCEHRVCGLLTGNSIWFIDSMKVEKLPDKAKDAGLFAIYKRGTEETKLRIYQHTYKNQPKSRSVVIK